MRICDICGTKISTRGDIIGTPISVEDICYNCAHKGKALWTKIVEDCRRQADIKFCEEWIKLQNELRATTIVDGNLKKNLAGSTMVMPRIVTPVIAGSNPALPASGDL